MVGLIITVEKKKSYRLRSEEDGGQTSKEYQHLYDGQGREVNKKK